MATWLKALAQRLRPGGLLMLHEPDFHGLQSSPPVDMAHTLFRAFRRAGLPNPTMRLQTAVGGGKAIADWLVVLADLAGSLQVAMQRRGVVSAEELDLPNLATLIRRDVTESDAMVFGRSEVGAWCRLPDEA